MTRPSPADRTPGLVRATGVPAADTRDGRAAAIRPAGDEGSATVEAVGLMIPAIGACILLLVFGLHLAAAGQTLTAAAAAAARAASLQPSVGAALAAARSEAAANLDSRQRGEDSAGGGGCAQVVVGLDTGAFRPGGTAVVSLTCTLDLATLTGLGLPGQVSRTVTSRAPIDPYSWTAG